MPRIDILKSAPIVRSPRVLQLEGMFDVAPTERSEERWQADVPLEDRPWSIGAIVGPSGAGKSTIARELFGDAVIAGYDWPKGRSIIDGFPKAHGTKAITGLLSSVGFSSPPAWLRPYAVLSTGQQFRVTLARALADDRPLIAIDEFTSVVDRTVAQIGSAAVAKAVRRAGKQFVAVTCHYDVLEWLQPDWVFEPALARFHWRELQRRPPIDLVVSRTGPETWQLFRGHHYLSADIHRAARLFLACWRDQPVALTAVLPSAGFKDIWREHRTVCLPDFQGVGIGNAMSAFVGSIVAAATGGRYRSVTSHPAFTRARLGSPVWRLVAKSMMSGKSGGRIGIGGRNRLAATFEYVGAPFQDVTTARRLWSESFAGSRTKAMTHTVSRTG